jgi:hypothetical protein
MLQHKHQLGKRVAKRVDAGGGFGAWRWYCYDGLRVIAAGTGTSDKTYYTGGVCRDANGTKLLYHHDRLGNVVAVSDANGNLYSGYPIDEEISPQQSVLEVRTTERI